MVPADRTGYYIIIILMNCVLHLHVYIVRIGTCRRQSNPKGSWWYWASDRTRVLEAKDSQILLLSRSDQDPAMQRCYHYSCSCKVKNHQSMLESSLIMLLHGQLIMASIFRRGGSLILISPMPPMSREIIWNIYILWSSCASLFTTLTLTACWTPFLPLSLPFKWSMLSRVTTIPQREWHLSL